MKDFFICSPEHYASEEVQLYIRHKLRERDKQWIYELIKYACNGVVTMRNHETVHIDTDAWMLCRDVHPGRDTRYLVVFKDRRLLTVRDLDGSHVGMLTDMQDRVSLFMRQHHGDGWRKYRSFFLYMGSQALRPNRIYALGDIFDSNAAGFSISIQFFDFLMDSDDDMMV